MQPGTYLSKRRHAAGLSLGEVARQLALLQFGIVAYQAGAIARQMKAAEASGEPLDNGQLALLRHVFPLDAEIYRKLVLRHTAAPEDRPPLPLPMVCRACACSWCDPCHPAAGTPAAFATGTCAWADEPGNPDDPRPICTACAEMVAIPILALAPGGAPVPEPA